MRRASSTRAQILLAADAGASDEEIARSVGVDGSTGYRSKRRFMFGNLEAAPTEAPRPGADRNMRRRNADFHLDSARVKLGASTRSEAAIKAVLGQFIKP
jgi:hypothetical protein